MYKSPTSLFSLSNFRGVFFTYINKKKKIKNIFISKKHASKLGLFDVSNELIWNSV